MTGSFDTRAGVISSKLKLHRATTLFKDLISHWKSMQPMAEIVHDRSEVDGAETIKLVCKQSSPTASLLFG